MLELPQSGWLASQLLSLASASRGAPEASIARRLSLRRLERARQSALGLVLQRLLVRTDEACGEHRANHGCDEDRDAHRPGIMLERAAEQVAAYAKDRRPNDP